MDQLAGCAFVVNEIDATCHAYTVSDEGYSIPFDACILLRPI